MDLLSDVYGLTSKWWLSESKLKHYLADCFYEAGSLLYKIKKMPDSETIRERVEEQCPEIENENIQKYVRDIKRCWLKYGIEVYEYFLYDFPRVSDAQKKAYISDVERLKYASILNKRRHARVFKFKYKTYQIFEKFYKREIILADDINIDFVERHPRFMLKLEHASKGDGAQIVSIEDFKNYAELEDYVNERGGLCEELISQDSRMSVWHSCSINTIRVLTLKDSEGIIHIWGATLRTGRGGSIIDNACKGGIFALVDCKSGEIISDGIDLKNERYIAHPDTGTVFKGNRIPEWDALCSIVERAASVLEDIRYVGWDFALSDKGWIMVEGNSQGQMTPQWADQIPRKEELLGFIYPYRTN